MSGLQLAGVITGSALAILILIGGGFVLGWTVRAVNANHEVDDQTGDITARADQRLAETRNGAQTVINAITEEANRRIDKAEQTAATLQRQLSETNENLARAVGQVADLNRDLVALRVDHKTVLTENTQLAAKNERIEAELNKFGALVQHEPAEADAHLARVWEDGLTEPDDPGDLGQNTKSWLREPSTRAVRAATDPNSPEYKAAEAAIAAITAGAETFDAWNGDTYPVEPAKPDADAVAAEHGPLPETTPVRKVTRPTRRSRKVGA